MKIASSTGKRLETHTNNDHAFVFREGRLIDFSHQLSTCSANLSDLCGTTVQHMDRQIFGEPPSAASVKK